MTGRTGYTYPTDAAGFDPDGDIQAVYEHFDPLIGESVANAATLPSTGNWKGRLVMAEDTTILWLCTNNAGAGTWKSVWSDWISYTPTLANVTLGTGGTVTAQYSYAGVNVKTRIKIILGTGGSMGAGPTFTLPVTHATLFANDQILAGDFGYLDTSATMLYPGKVLMTGSSTTVAKLYHTNTGAFIALGASAPFPWGASDVVLGYFEFVPA